MFGSCSDIFVRHSPVKSVLRLDRLDSVEQSFDTEPLAGRSWGTSGIVTTYRDRWRGGGGSNGDPIDDSRGSVV